MTRLVIVGAGAVGASVAAELHRAGGEALLIARGAHLEAIRERGLRYVRPDGVSTVHVPVAAGPDEVELRESDVLVLATKSQDAGEAVRDWAWQPVKRADGSTGVAATDLPILTLQNGLANERTALRHFAKVLGAVIWIPAGYLKAGEVVSHGEPNPAVVWLGDYPSGLSEQADAVAAELQRAGLAVRVVPDIVRWKAGKLLGNLVNGLDALYPPSPLRQKALEALRAEALTILAAHDIEPAYPGEALGEFRVAEIPGHPRGGNSTWQSLARNTTPETDYLNGEIVLLARLAGLGAPLNAAIQARIHRAVAVGTAAGSLDDADLAASLPLEPPDPRAKVLITAADLHRRLAEPGPPVLLDVRWALGDPNGADHYREGHIPGAVYADLDTELAAPHPAGDTPESGDTPALLTDTQHPAAGRHPLPAIGDLQAAARRWGITRKQGVVVYDNSGGLAAARAWWLLRWAGVDDVRILDGGLAAWADGGYGQATGDARTRPASDIVLSAGHLPTLTAEEAAALPERGTLLDARAGERYRGEVEPIDPRAGHIPGAVSAPTAANLAAGLPLFRSTEELRERFAGIEGPVGVYCGSGVTAAHEIAALAVAGIDAALYPGSWSAWSADPARPAATGGGEKDAL